MSLPVRASFLAALATAGQPLAACDGRPEPAAEATVSPRPAPGTLSSAGPMRHARAAHTATALLDGRVLVAGGMVGEDPVDAALEVYDPASGTFAVKGALLTPRHSHTATLLPDGTVLLAGGYDATGTYLRTTEIHHPGTGTTAPAPPMHVGRAGHVAVPLQDGRVLIAGGVGEGWTFLSSAEVFDPSSASFTPTGAMSVPRESHAAVRLPDGRVLIAGGHRGRRHAIELYRSAEVYDPATGAFAPAGDMATRRHKHDAVLLADGRVLVTGGSDERDSAGVYTSTEIYDPNTGAFRPGADLRLPRYKHAGTSVRMPDGRVLLGGGAARAEVYDPASGTSTLVNGEPRLAGLFSATAPLPGGGVLITGGYGASLGPQRGAWVYRPDAASPGASRPTQRRTGARP